MEEREGISYFHDKGLQFLELLIFAESHNFKNSENKYIVKDAEHFLMMDWANDNSKELSDKVKDFQRLWLITSTKYFDEWTK